MTVISASSLPCTSRTASARVAGKVWQRPASGVYVDHGHPLTDPELVAVARARVGPAFVVTGTVVLRALGLPWLPATSDIHVLVPPEVDRPSNGVVRVTRTTGLPELARWTRHGAAFADVERATVDCARSLDSLCDVRGVVLGAVGTRWATPGGLTEMLASTQRNGSALTRRAIGDARRGCASPPEAELVDELVGRAAPFYVNPDVYVGSALIGSPDIWLLGRGVGGEVESREWHGSDEQEESTYDRHERFRSRGIELVHLSVRRVRRDVAEAASYLLSRPPVREPSGLRIEPRGPLLR